MGIEGDRYYQPNGSQVADPKTGREITLIEMEAIEAMRQNGIQISPDQTRRNIVTSSVSLNDLVGMEFTVGEIRLRGIRLCEPCDYLADRTDPRILYSMSHRGGLRADIITQGYIHINDLIIVSQKEHA